MAVTYEKLEKAFYKTLARNRAGLTNEECPSEAYTAHAFFHIGTDTAPADMSILPNVLPFESIWLITNYRGLAFCAYIERIHGIVIRPDYLWYPREIEGERIRLTEAEVDQHAAFVIDRALTALLTNHAEEVESQARNAINANRAKEGKLGPLPAFIRVMNRPLPANDDDHEDMIGGEGGQQRSSPQGHDRKGHWRTYKASGKRVWINSMRVNGGSDQQRLYRV